jgi:hypothetical protein
LLNRSRKMLRILLFQPEVVQELRILNNSNGVFGVIIIPIWSCPASYYPCVANSNIPTRTNIL